MIDWKRKLAAYLHDPPEKAYDFGERHKDRAKTHAESFGVGELWQAMGGNPDWCAAAADRFVFPHGSKLRSSLSDAPSTAFVHPMTGRDDSGKSALPAAGLAYPNQQDAEAWLADIRPEWKSNDPQTLLLRAWREWFRNAAQHASGESKGSVLLPYLPADTRIPDGSIWHHCAVVSALEATRAAEEKGAALDPAFLIFQIGPVQDFIAQARSTRDLWSGSYLLSWLTMHAIKAVADQCGPDAIIFPNLKGQPIYDFLEQRLELKPHPNDVLVPAIPNRFLAVVPATFDATRVLTAFNDEWRLIACECQSWLKSKGLPFDQRHQKLWEEQIEGHWQVAWQLWPWQSVNKALAAFRELPLGAGNPIHFARIVAENIPDDHKDERCHRGGQLDPGWAWSVHYQLCQYALDARRSLRDFRPFAFDASRKPGHRDCLSGREEAVAQADTLEKATQSNPDLGHLFRHIEPLGAANLIKRVWHKAYLARLNEVEGKNQPDALYRARESFDSVPSTAAGAFADRLYNATGSSGVLREKWLHFAEAASDARDEFPETIAAFNVNDERHWLERTDHCILFPEVWRREQKRRKRSHPSEFYHSSEAREKFAKAENALRALLKQANARPSHYYAVLAMDGDQIGQWLSGEKSPAIRKVLSHKAANYFREHVPGEQTEQWLKSPRPISPSWHLQFSEALANFGLHATRRIVEDVHHGQLIYAGGDDVLAMLPADEAIACCLDLRAAFQGRRQDMTDGCREHFRDKAPEGFLWLAKPQKEEPSWPLLVPGPRMTVSAGIAIGHVKEPLQDMIAEAHHAEKRAKAPPEKRVFDRSDKDPAKQTLQWKPNEGWDRDALAVTLFKRSGETIRWGARFGSPAFPLLEFVQTYFRTPWNQPMKETAITGRFPYRLAELLGRYGPSIPVSDILDIAKRETAFVIARQTLKDMEAVRHSPGFTRSGFEKLCNGYLENLGQFSWARPNEHLPTLASRPLAEFVNLFLIEAFIRRQAD